MKPRAMIPINVEIFSFIVLSSFVFCPEYTDEWEGKTGHEAGKPPVMLNGTLYVPLFFSSSENHFSAILNEVGFLCFITMILSDCFVVNPVILL